MRSFHRLKQLAVQQVRLLQLTLCMLIITSCAQTKAQDTVSSPEPEVTLSPGQMIIDVRIEGWQTIPAEIILQKIQAQPHRPLTERMLREDKRTLLNTRWFYEVRERIDVTDAGNILVFSVRERPIVTAVRYRGNSAIKEKHLNAWTGLSVGSPFDYVANQEAARRIQQEYREKGYYFAEVILLKGDKPEHREVVFEIKEGPKVKVVDRTFRGNKFWTDGDLRKNLISKEAILFWGGKYTPETLPADVEALKTFYRGVGFFDVEVTAETIFSADKADVVLHYTVVEGPRYTVRSIRYEGNSVISTKQLQEDSRLLAGQKFSSYPLSRDVQRMLALYGELGHYFASVQPVPLFIEEGTAEVELVFQIDEDRKRYIRNIDVSYEGDYPHTKQTVVLDRIQVQPGDLANPRLIRRGRSRLAGSGLFEPNIAFDVEPVDPEQTSFAMTSAVIRGQDPHDEATDWTSEFLRTIPFSGQNTRADLEIGNYGNLFRESSKRTNQETSGGDSAHATELPPPDSESEQGPQPGQSASTTSEKSVPQSTAVLPVSRLITHQTVAPAELFRSVTSPAQSLFASAAADQDLIIRAQSPDEGRSGSVPTIEDALIGESPFRNQFREVPPGYVDINVRATEGRTGRMMFGAGVNSNAGLVGNFVWDESNFDIFRPPMTLADVLEGRAWRGGGQRFRAEAAPGDQVSRYALTWTDPYFLYTNYSLSVSGFYFNRYYPDWTEDRLGGRISVGRQFTPEWSAAVAMRLEDIEMKNARVPTPLEVQQWIGHSFLSTLRVSLTHDTRDSAMLPSEGHFADLGYEQAFNDFSFPKLDAEFRQYYTTHSRADGSGRQVLTFAGSLGWTGDDTPVFERYYAGGFQSFRGFRYRGVTPRDVTGFSTGGTFQALGTVEYRIPITADDMFSMVAFSDFGTVDNEIDLNEFRVTAGFGLRMTIPAMGPVPLAFDFAFPILTEDYDQEQVFSFYVGINR